MMHRLLISIAFLLSIGLIACKSDTTSKGTSESVLQSATEDFVKKNGTTMSAIMMPGETQLKWSGSKPGKTHKGYINIKEGRVKLSDDAIVGGSVIMDMKSLTVTDLKGESKSDLESHLKGMGSSNADDFFNVKKYPTSKFEITRIARLSNDENYDLLIYGDLTIKDVTKEIAFKASVNYEGSELIMSSEEFSINRTDWGINFMSKSFFDNLKDRFIEDKVDLQFVMRATTSI